MVKVGDGENGETEINTLFIITLGKDRTFVDFSMVVIHGTVSISPVGK